MSVQVIEVTPSRPTLKAKKSSTHERVFTITGAGDSATALNNLVLAAPNAVIADGVRLNNVEYFVEPLGSEIWEGVVTYSHKSSNRSEQQNDRLAEVDDTETSFDFSGQTIHVTEALQQARYGDSPDVGGAINVTEDGPQGVDIFAPGGVINRSRVFAGTFINDEWIKERAQKIGKTNDHEFMGFAEGELLFTRFSGRQRGFESDWVVTFGFDTGSNRTGITVGDFNNIEKKAWQYLWVKYEKDEDETAKTIVPKAQGVYVADVYNSTDFSTLGV